MEFNSSFNSHRMELTLREGRVTLRIWLITNSYKYRNSCFFSLSESQQTNGASAQRLSSQGKDNERELQQFLDPLTLPSSRSHGSSTNYRSAVIFYLIFLADRVELLTVFGTVSQTRISFFFLFTESESQRQCWPNG